MGQSDLTQTRCFVAVPHGWGRFCRFGTMTGGTPSRLQSKSPTGGRHAYPRRTMSLTRMTLRDWFAAQFLDGDGGFLAMSDASEDP